MGFAGSLFELLKLNLDIQPMETKMITKLSSDLNTFEVIDYIQRDMTFNKRINYSDMIEYLKGELHIYLKTNDITQEDATYKNRFGQQLRITTLLCKNLKIIVREKITEEADVRFIALDGENDSSEATIEDL